jgi:hypothetical protein
MSPPSRQPRTPGATQVRRYGRTDVVQITERACLWYGCFRSRTVRVILVRDDKPRTRGRDDRGYGLPLVITDLESSAEDLVARYASQWGIEQAFADARQIMGVGEARNRTRRAVERTVPFGLICFSVVTVWYTLHGHAPDDVASHRTRARWYPSNSAGSSSPPDFAAHALSRPPRKKPGPSSPPGQPPGLDQQKLRNTSDLVGARNSAHLMPPADTRGGVHRAGPAVGRRWSRLSWTGEVAVGAQPGRKPGAAGGCRSGRRTARARQRHAAGC